MGQQTYQEDTPIVAARRRLLAEEIVRQGLANLARITGKPDRQIKDMAAGRKSFGDRISKEIGPLIRPDLPRDWLIWPEDTDDHGNELIGGKVVKVKAILGSRQVVQRHKDIAAINHVLSTMTDQGIRVVLRQIVSLAEEFPIQNKQAK